MSNTRKRKQPAPTNPLLDALTGQTLSGGCDQCAAEQTIVHEAPGVYRCVIAHDVGCPFLARRRAGAR